MGRSLASPLDFSYGIVNYSLHRRTSVPEVSAQGEPLAFDEPGERREVIEMVYNALTSNSVPAGDGRLDAGHLTQLRKEGRYKPVKNGVGAVLVSA